MVVFSTFYSSLIIKQLLCILISFLSFIEINFFLINLEENSITSKSISISLLFLQPFIEIINLTYNSNKNGVVLLISLILMTKLLQKAILSF